MLNFQSDAKEALEAETPDSSQLDRLIEFGMTLDIDLPEIPKLKQVCTTNIYTACAGLTLLGTLISAGFAFSFYKPCITCLGKH